MPLTDREKKGLKTYGTWRPRVGRGAEFAIPAGVLAGMAGKKGKNLMLPAALAAGAAGVGDKMLEEKADKSHQVQKLVGEGFQKSAGVSSLRNFLNRHATKEAAVYTEKGLRERAARRRLHKQGEPDTHPEDSGAARTREPWSTFTQAAEAASLRDGHGMISDLFSRKGRTSSAAQQQLSQLFPQSNEDSFGRSVTVSSTAADASRKTKAAFRR